jgi:hypothetical protein
MVLVDGTQHTHARPVSVADARTHRVISSDMIRFSHTVLHLCIVGLVSPLLVNRMSRKDSWLWSLNWQIGSDQTDRLKMSS